MGYISRRVSDLTGVEAEDKDFVELIVRRAPGLTEPVRLDVLPSEIAGLKSAGEVVVIEVRNGDTKQLIVTVSEWKKLAPNIDEIVANADGVKGRRKNFRPSTS